MGATMQIDRRAAREADIPFLLSLRRETMDGHLMASGESTTDEAHLARLMHHFDCAEILLSNGRPAGLFKLRRMRDAWEIVQIQLSSRFQGQGIGRLLLEELIADAAAAGADVKLSVLKANPARRLYERLGFKVIGEDAHEYCMRRAA
jgi:ribosomal protein S18 acetylase RimI-like enzyme